MRFLVTRPEPDAERTAKTLRSQGHAVTIAPLLRVETLENVEIGAGPWAAILVTSANAARAIAAHKHVAELRALPVLAVGERSADAMRSAGFADVSSAEGAAGDLTGLAAKRLKRGDLLLYLAGADRSVGHCRRPCPAKPSCPYRRGLSRGSGKRAAGSSDESLARRYRRRAAFLTPQRGGLCECRTRRRFVRSRHQKADTLLFVCPGGEPA